MFRSTWRRVTDVRSGERATGQCSTRRGLRALGTDRLRPIRFGFLVRLLLAHGALVDLPNASGVTPFMAAAGIGTRGGGAGVLGPGTPDDVVSLSLETLEILRQAGADVNARITDVTSLTGRIARANTMTGKQGQTALFHAAEFGRADVVRYLLQHGASVDVRDDAGRTPGAVARSKEIAALLPPAGGFSR